MKTYNVENNSPMDKVHRTKNNTKYINLLHKQPDIIHHGVVDETSIGGTVVLNSNQKCECEDSIVASNMSVPKTDNYVIFDTSEKMYNSSDFHCSLMR